MLTSKICTQNQTADIVLAGGLATYSTVPGKLVTLPPGGLAYSQSVTGATCLSLSFSATAPVTVLLEILADFQDTFSLESVC